MILPRTLVKKSLPETSALLEEISYFSIVILIECHTLQIKYEAKNRGYEPVKSKLQHPPLPLPLGIPRAFDVFSCLRGREFDHHSQGLGNLIASLDIMLPDKSWRRRQTLMNSKEKIAYLWRIG